MFACWSLLLNRSMTWGEDLHTHLCSWDRGSYVNMENMTTSKTLQRSRNLHVDHSLGSCGQFLKYSHHECYMTWSFFQWLIIWRYLQFKLNIHLVFLYCISWGLSVCSSDRKVCNAECSAMFLVAPDQTIIGKKGGEKNPFLKISTVLVFEYLQREEKNVFF